MLRQSPSACLSFAAVLLLAGCAGSQAGSPTIPVGQLPGSLPAQTSPAFPALPAPADLAWQLPPRQGSAFTEADLILDGSQFELALPNQRVTQDVNGARFQPDFTQVSNFDQAGLAYAMYVCSAPGYDRESAGPRSGRSNSVNGILMRTMAGNWI